MKLHQTIKLAASVLALVLATQASGQDKTVLNYWTWAPAEPVLQKAITAFEAEHPDVDVQLTFLESTAYQDRLPLALSSGDPIDVAAIQTSTMVKLVKDYLEPLPPLFDEYASAPVDSLLSERALNQAKMLAGDDTLYLAPFGVLGSAAVYYNVDLMDELGLAVPTNREELASFVATIKEKRPDLVPISLSGAGWVLDEITNTITEQATPGFFNSVRYNTGGKWNSPEYKAAFDATVSLYADGILGRDTLDLDYGRSVELFQQGQAVAFIQGTWESGILSAPFRATNGIALDNVTTSGLPVVVDGGTPSIRSFIEVGMAVTKTSEHKELATQFIEFMTAGKGIDQWSDTLFVVPAAKGYKYPDGIFSTETAALGYAGLSELLLTPGSDRNNVSDFSNVAGDAIIDSIVNGTDSQKQIEYLQSEWDSGRYSNAL